MDFLKRFFQTRPPKAGSSPPAYFTKALYICERLLFVYLLLSCLGLAWGIQHAPVSGPEGLSVFQPMPLVLAAVLLFSLVYGKKWDFRFHLGVIFFTSVFWVSWSVHFFGWSLSAQDFLLPLFLLIFFNVYEPAWRKIVFFLLLLGFRTGLYFYASSVSVSGRLSGTAEIVLKCFNSLTAFGILALLCILFSSNIQATERQLRLDNQALHKEASTDQLTQLPNRRMLLDEAHHFIAENPSTEYSVAIADIDFFKQVNDTYGHACGDYTLKAIANCFLEHGQGLYSVCRWGGEEFCFFIPKMNLDNAGILMQSLNVAVRRLPLHFEDQDFHVTITIGVAECDFSSPLEAIIEEADQHLYIGKRNGRDQVVL